MNTLNLEAAAKNLMTIDTTYGPRKASRRVFRVTRKVSLCDEGTHVRLIADLPYGEPNIYWTHMEATVNACQGNSPTFYIPIDALEAL